MHWKKNSGFRLYKFTNEATLNSARTLNYQVLSDLYDNKICKLTEHQIERYLSQIRKEHAHKLTEKLSSVNSASNFMRNEIESNTSSMTEFHLLNNSETNRM